MGVIKAEDFQEDLAVGFWVQLFIRALATRFSALEQAYADLREQMGRPPPSLIAEALGSQAVSAPRQAPARRYQPRPVETGAVNLSPDLRALSDRLAENAHNHSALVRLAAGWRWGPVRDDAWKKNPCLIPFAELPEAEKGLDRRGAMETVRAILALGYEVRLPRRRSGGVSVIARSSTGVYPRTRNGRRVASIRSVLVGARKRRRLAGAAAPGADLVRGGTVRASIAQAAQLAMRACVRPDLGARRAHRR